MVVGHLLKGKIILTNTLPKHLMTWKVMIVSELVRNPKLFGIGRRGGKGAWKRRYYLKMILLH